ncbi:hypothetical protein C3B79_1457 [Aeromonas hydrophila]|nr:hypothetical protein C3B79_1457 [Aeromonas hydrophila]
MSHIRPLHDYLVIPAVLDHLCNQIDLSVFAELSEVLNGKT